MSGWQLGWSGARGREVRVVTKAMGGGPGGDGHVPECDHGGDTGTPPGDEIM